MMFPLWTAGPSVLVFLFYFFFTDDTNASVAQRFKTWPRLNAAALPVYYLFSFQGFFFLF